MLSDRTKNLLIVTGVAFGIAATSFCLLFFLKQDYSLVGWINACFFSGGVTLLLGLLGLAMHWGAFDMFAYGVRYLFWGLRAKREEKPYEDYVDYSKQKREKRKKRKYFFLIPFAVFGLGLLIASLVLRAVYGANTGL